MDRLANRRRERSRRIVTAAAQAAVVEALESRMLLSRFAIIGDVTQGTPSSDVSNLVKSWSPDFIVSTGDNVHGDSSIDKTIGRYYHDFVSPYNGSFGAGSPSGNRMYSALGNHDYDNGLSDDLAFWTFPNNERYYNIRKGDTELFIVNSNPQEGDGTSSTSKQGQFIKNALAASTAAFKLVFFHFPAYTSGTEGNHPGMQWPFQQWGATAVFSGHDHMYERLLKNGFPYFVNGLAGATIVPPDHVESGSQVRYSNDYGALLVNTSGNSINFQFITRTGSVKDDYTVTVAGTPTPTAPSTPTNFNVTAQNSTQAKLTWSDASPGSTTSFKIERSTDGGSTFDPLTTTSASVTTYTDQGLTPGATYVYRVRASNSAGDSNPTAAKSVTLPTGSTTYISDMTWVSSSNGWGPVERDQSVGGSGSNDGNQITLNGVKYDKGLGAHAASQVVVNLNKQYGNFLADVGLDDETGPGTVVFQVLADGVKIYDSGVMTQAAATKSVNLDVSNVTQLTLVITNGGDNIDYDHADWANARLQANSNPAPTNPPNAPTGLAASAASSSQINLTWTDASSDETGFILERSPNGTGSWSQIATPPTNATSYSDSTGLSPSTQYFYRVRAVNAAGPSSNSNIANATTTSAPSSGQVTYIPTGSMWKYLDTGTNQGTAWRATAFDDSAWKSGAGQLGYGDGDEATVVSYGPSANNKFVTTYFRKTFSVTDPSQVSGLALRILRDDGAVVYVNGTEVYRTNMPNGTIGYTTRASNAIEDNTFYAASFANSLLVAGNNVIAVEIHQADLNSSDISFDFELKATVTTPATLQTLAQSEVRPPSQAADSIFSNSPIDSKTGQKDLLDQLL